MKEVMAGIQQKKRTGRYVRVSGISLYPDQWAAVDTISEAIGGRSKAIRFMVELLKAMEDRITNADVAQAYERAGRQDAPAN